jgi:hypothetical protein
MKLVVTIDVEEEGLFSNCYDQDNCMVENVRHLERLDPLFRELDIRPTMLVAYPVINHSGNCSLLNRLRRDWNAEIGAHLHSWNTPPLRRIPGKAPVPSERIPVDLLEEKLQTLLTALRRADVEPTSFRMGRFNLGPRMFSVLERTNVLVDSSIAPMRHQYGGPDHLAANTDPYFPNPLDPVCAGNSRILEVPVTILPVLPGLGRFLNGLRTRGTVPSNWISWFAMNLGSFPAQPMWTGLNRLKTAARLHRMRGGKVLTIFFHSSELMPGGCPAHPSSSHVERFLARLRAFLSWLRREMGVDSLTLSELHPMYEDARSMGEGAAKR